MERLKDILTRIATFLFMYPMTMLLVFWINSAINGFISFSEFSYRGQGFIILVPLVISLFAAFSKRDPKEEAEEMSKNLTTKSFFTGIATGTVAFIIMALVSLAFSAIPFWYYMIWATVTTGAFASTFKEDPKEIEK
jgi:CDP-diglyceride synthetase